MLTHREDCDMGVDCTCGAIDVGVVVQVWIADEDGIGDRDGWRGVGEATVSAVDGPDDRGRWRLSLVPCSIVDVLVPVELLTLAGEPGGRVFEANGSTYLVHVAPPG